MPESIRPGTLAWCGVDMSPSRQAAIEASHVYAIDALAAETGRPMEEVAEIYLRELAHRIEDYLVLLTSRHVREALRGSDRRFLEPVAFNPRHLGWPIIWHRLASSTGQR
jgi:hypothetical protein